MMRNEERRLEPNAEDDGVLILNQYTTMVKYECPFVTKASQKVKHQARRHFHTDEYSPDTLTPQHFVHCTTSKIHDSNEVIDSNLPYIEVGNGIYKETEDILNLIIPPRKWKDQDGDTWTQVVSSVSSTRGDVVRLSEVFDKRLKERKARETGIDNVRRGLYTQLFDELIRQCTIECAEYGLLLYRVRNELQLTFQCYENLYTSASAYGIRKVLQAQAEKDEIKKHGGETYSEVENLKMTVVYLQEKLEEKEKNYTQLREKLMAERLTEYEAKKAEQETTKMQIWAALMPKASVTK